MRTCPCCGSELFEDPPLLVNLDENVIYANCGNVRVQPQQAEIASVLWGAFPNAVRMGSIIRKVWALREPEDVELVVRVQICRLRKALKPLHWTINARTPKGGLQGYRLEQLQ